MNNKPQLKPASLEILTAETHTSEKRKTLRIKVGEQPVKQPAMPCTTIVY